MGASRGIDPLPPLSSQISNLEPQILLKKAFPCVNAAGKDDKCLRYPSPIHPLYHAQVFRPWKAKITPGLGCLLQHPLLFYLLRGF